MNSFIFNCPKDNPPKNSNYNLHYLNFLQNIAYFKWLIKQSRFKVEEIRLKKLRKTVKFAIENSNFYRELYKEAGINKEDVPSIKLEDLPYTNKKLLMEHFDDVVTDKRLKYQNIVDNLDKFKDTNFPLMNYEILTTSGTSGVIGVFPVKIEDFAVYGALTPSYLFSAFDFFFKNLRRCRFASCVVIGPRTGFLMSKYLSNNFLTQSYCLSVLDPLDIVVKKLNEIQPDFLGGYASTLGNLALEQLAGRLRIAPKFIISSGDALTDTNKENIQKAFNITPCDLYASTEGMIMGFRQYENFYSIFDPLCYLEKGYVSNLCYRIFPIIRYKIDDELHFIEDYSSNPFTKVKLETLRSINIKIKNNQGRLIELNSVVLSTLILPGMKAYQFCKTNENSLLIRVIGKGENLKNQVADGVLKFLKAYQADQSVTFEIQIVDNIPIDPKTGKIRSIIP